MCRNIKTLANFDPPATQDEIRASALQFVRKLSGMNRPSKANEAAFDRAVDEVTAAAERLIASLTTNAPPRNRDVEAEKARTRSRRRFASVILVVIAASSLMASQSVPAELTPQAAAAARATLERSRAEADRTLRESPTSYLATVARQDFGERTTLTVGRAPDNDVRLDAADLQPHHLKVTVAGDTFHVEAVDAGAGFTLNKKDLRDAVVGPAYLGVGRFLLRLSHQRFPAIIVFDPRSPRFKEYKGLAYFPIDFRYRFELPLTPNPAPEQVIIMSTLGHQRRALRVGWFDFIVDGTPCRLEATRLLEPGVGDNDIMVLFRDRTSGNESYPLGRYVDVTRQTDGTYLLDFNTAYNPACAFSDHYNCPIPPRGNTLAVAIRAGERDPHYH